MHRRTLVALAGITATALTAFTPLAVHAEGK